MAFYTLFFNVSAKLLRDCKVLHLVV